MHRNSILQCAVRLPRKTQLILTNKRVIIRKKNTLPTNISIKAVSLIERSRGYIKIILIIIFIWKKKTFYILKHNANRNSKKITPSRLISLYIIDRGVQWILLNGKLSYWFISRRYVLPENNFFTIVFSTYFL